MHQRPQRAKVRCSPGIPIQMAQLISQFFQGLAIYSKIQMKLPLQSIFLRHYLQEKYICYKPLFCLIYRSVFAFASNGIGVKTLIQNRYYFKKPKPTKQMSNNFCKLDTTLLGHSKIHNRYNQEYTNQLTCELHVIYKEKLHYTFLKQNSDSEEKYAFQFAFARII